MNIDPWIARFARNQTRRPEPDWHAPITLRGPALHKLTRSLQQFQLGDGGGPAHLIAWNRRSLLASDDGMRTLIDCWFREEKEHSRLLGAALERFGVPPIRSHWSFSLFCGVRRWLGVNFELQALLLTEIVSHVYYKMLHRQVDDVAVRGMCALIIRDEAGHIAFHRARLAAEAGRTGATYGRLWEASFRLRGLAAGTVLWISHGSALRANGARNATFYRGIWKGMSRFVVGLRGDLAKEPAAGSACARPLPGYRSPRHRRTA